MVLAAVSHLAAPGARVADVATEIGYSEPSQRVLAAAVGYGPKMLVRVARLRRLVSLRDGSLASRALEAGYAARPT